MGWFLELLLELRTTFTQDCYYSIKATETSSHNLSHFLT